MDAMTVMNVDKPIMLLSRQTVNSSNILLYVINTKQMNINN